MIKSVLAAIFIALAAAGAAQAQEQIVLPCYQNPSAGGQGCIPVSAANPLPVTGGGGGGGGAVTLPLTPSIANGSGVVPTQGGAVLSATNGDFTNILQGNAVLSTGNPIFTQLTAGAASIGTVAATQSGTWNVTNISGTISLPTGAATAANQTNVIGTKNAGTAATNSILDGLVFNSSPLTLTTGQQASLQGDANGYLKVNVAVGGGGVVTVADGADVTQGAIADSAATAGGTGTVSAKLRETTSLLNSILTSVSSALPAPAGTPTQTSVACGTGSTTFLAASTATQFIMIKVPQTAANAVWFNFAGNAAVAAAPSVDIPVGGSLLWGATSFLPTTQINCIASASTTVTLMYK